MRMLEFVRENREELETVIRRVVRSSEFKLTAVEIEQWVMNDEGLYQWARSSGCRADSSRLRF